MLHEITFKFIASSAARAVCSCGWQSPVCDEGDDVSTWDYAADHKFMNEIIHGDPSAPKPQGVIYAGVSDEMPVWLL